MLDPKLLKNDVEQVVHRLRQRGFSLELSTLQRLESQCSLLQKQIQTLRTDRNSLSKAIGQAKARGELAQDLMNKATELGLTLQKNEAQWEAAQKAWLDFQLTLPNLLDESVPIGMSKNDNLEIRRWGEPTIFDFPSKDHVTLGETLGAINFKAAATLSGSRFVVLQGDLAKLQRALAQFMLDIHIEQHGYQEIYVPYLVHAEMLYGTGQLPKFSEDQFHTDGEGEKPLTLIPTAEVPLVNLVRHTIVDTHQLPLKYVAHTPCFRREAGTYGQETRGMIRQHQFQKVELVQLVEASHSYAALEDILGHAEKILQLLELPYRVTLLCSGETGFASAKTYDLEVWLPGKQTYCEVSSCSNCETFQTRRIKARHRSAQEKPTLLHSLNGSGLAVGRTLIAVMENYQDSSGQIHIPRILEPYMGKSGTISGYKM